MSIEAFQNFMKNKGFNVIGKNAYGMESGFPVQVTAVAVRRNSVALNINFSTLGDTFKSIKKELNTAIKGKGAAMGSGERITLTIKTNDSAIDSDYTSAVNSVLEVFKSSYVNPPQACPACGQGNCDVLAVYGTKGYRPVHRRCLHSALDSVKIKANNNVENGSYLIGIIGGILGCIVGCIPSVLSIWFTETIYSILYALIPLCSYYGYKLFKGKLTKASIFITIILSLIGVYLIEYMLMNLSLMAQYGVPMYVCIPETIKWLVYPDIWKDMTVSAGSSFIFIILGIWVAWGHISRTVITEVKSMESVMDTVTPNPGYNNFIERQEQNNSETF